MTSGTGSPSCVSTSATTPRTPRASCAVRRERRGAPGGWPGAPRRLTDQPRVNHAARALSYTLLSVVTLTPAGTAPGSDPGPVQTTVTLSYVAVGHTCVQESRLPSSSQMTVFLMRNRDVVPLYLSILTGEPLPTLLPSPPAHLLQLPLLSACGLMCMTMPLTVRLKGAPAPGPVLRHEMPV